jgi:hypothetical protein
MFRKHRDRLLESYALDCIAYEEPKIPPQIRYKPAPLPGRDEAERFLQRALRAGYSWRNSPGLGRLLSLSGAGLSGSALVHRDDVLHGCLLAEGEVIVPIARPMPEPPGEREGPGGRVIYFSDFEGDVGPEWSSRKTDVTPKGKRGFLGQFANETVTLHLEDLLPHEELTVSFDLFIIRSWDGNHPVHGRDVWSLTARDVGTLLHTTFSNWSQAGQSYPESYGEGDFPMKTGASEKGTLGYAFRDLTDSVYRLSFTFPHTGHELTLHFSATGLEGPVDLESWGLDNVSVTVHPTGPSPDRETGRPKLPAKRACA